MAEQNEETPILVFPADLRSKVSNGSPHVRFSLIKRGSPEKKIVHLYMPQGVSFPDAMDYGTLDLGLIGGAISVVSEFMETGSVSGTTSDAIAASLQANILGSVLPGGVVTNLATGAAAGASAAAGANAKGVALNPYTQMAFNSTQVRTFNLNFKLIAESEKESKTAKDIENFFRKNMYPLKSGKLSLEYPATFQIDFFYGSKKNDYLPQIFESFLTSFSTTYNSTSNSFFRGGAPSEIDMSLSFQETRALTRADIYPEDPANEDEEGNSEGGDI